VESNEGSWSDLLNGNKEIPRRHLLEAEDLDEEHFRERWRSRGIRFLGIRITWDEDEDAVTSPASGIRFGHVRMRADMRLGLEAGAGKGWGGLTTQRMWHLGGPSSLRGYDLRRLTGTSFVRARGELARTYSFGSLSLFSDVAWAGESES
jgi:hypothetical protein